MQLGIISWIYEEDFKLAKERGMEFIELDVNDRAKEFLDNLEQTKELSKKYAMPIGAVGRWGADKVTATGIIAEEQQLEFQLIDAAMELDCDVYMTGCNYIETLSYEENCELGISYLEKLVEYGKQKGVKIATYNCRWNNYIHSEKAWNIIHKRIEDLYIKYDTSHCIYAGGDYLKETRDWGERFIHVHIKGALIIDGERYDDPPAGLDQTDWKSFFAILYTKGYDRTLSIEPHSSYWQGELGRKGVEFTIQFIRQLILK